MDRDSNPDRGCAVPGHYAGDSRHPGCPETGECGGGDRHRAPVLVGIPVPGAWHRDGQRTAYSRERSGESYADLSEVAFRRHGPQFLGAPTGGKDGFDSESRPHNVDGPAPDVHFPGTVRAILRHTTREDAVAGDRGQPGRFSGVGERGKAAAETRWERERGPERI